MLIYNNGDFVESDALELAMSELCEKHGGFVEDSYKAIGFEKKAVYRHSKEVEANDIEVYVREQGGEVIDAEFKYIVIWFYEGDFEEVLIRKKYELHNFLAKYLPALNLAAELNTKNHLDGDID